ncbi:uncharacterized protein LOC103853772 [Brassica rapa]|uniref:uncharacterized protein LOC103853772 n=1 Tax=Brassica campestris TaxID=3711 RepID=UPI00142E60C3|nr:uncharacterized protein LOC103853772 [Brassica rapa]
MEGVPDLSALLKGRLQLLSKESAPVGPSGVPDSGDQGGSKEGASNSNDEGVSVEPPAPSPKKKKKDKRTTGKSSDETSLPLSASLATSSEGQGTKKKKKKKRTRDEATSRDEATAMDDATPVERPKKKVKKKAAGTEPGSSVVVPSSADAAREGEVIPNVSLEEKRKALVQRSGSGSESAGGEKSVPGSSMSGGPRLEGTPSKTGRIEYPDRVEFLYDEATPLVLNPLRCAELTRQIRGGTKELPPVDDLYFKKEYIDAAMAGRRVNSLSPYFPFSFLKIFLSFYCFTQSDGSMNYLVEKYDSTLKQTMIQLGTSDKLARTRLGVIERLRAENKKASDKAAKEKEVLRVKFEELEGKLKSDRLAKKDALREKTRLERLVASLEKEKAELEGERDAVVGTLVKERQRLRDSRVQEVTRERIRVQTAMADKSTRCIGKMKGYMDRLIAREKAKNLYGQASGTKKCLEMIKDSGIAIPPSMINIFSEQEKMYEAEVANLYLEPFSEDDYALSPLNLPSRFVNEELMGVLDPYGSNVGLIGHESASQLITSREATEDPVDEPMVDITSALSERIVVPEGTTIEERPDGSDPETGGAIQTDTGDVAAEDPVLVSSSEEREEDEVGEEENRSSSALVEGMVPNLPVSDPRAQVEGLGNQVREEQTIEALDPSRDDQDVVV